MRVMRCVVLGLLVAGCACPCEEKGTVGAGMGITSPEILAGKPIPKRFSGEGEGVSPALRWTGAPAGTKEFALVLDDPSAPTPEPWVHWVVYGIPGDSTGLAENIPRTEMISTGAKQGLNSFNRLGYEGPMPNPGSGVHHYRFTLYALDKPLGLSPRVTKAALAEAMKGHVLGQVELKATYERK